MNGSTRRRRAVVPLGLCALAVACVPTASDGDHADAGASPAEIRRALHDATEPSTVRARSAVPAPIAPAIDGASAFAIRRPGLSVRFDARGFSLSAGLRMELAGAREITPIGEARGSGTVNSYVDEPSKWRVGLPTYGRLAWEEIYPGIDMIAEPAPGGFAYRFVLSPGADASAIAMRWSGARDVRAIDDGRGVAMETNAGSLRITGLRAFVAEANGARRQVPIRHVVIGSTVRVSVDGWDGASPLVIDPTVQWTTFVGGTDNGEYSTGITTDASGNVVLVGATASTNFPSTGGFDTTYGGGGGDAFVTKVSPTGALVWSSYLGGAGFDRGNDVAISATGDIYVAGMTDSTAFPSTGGYDKTLGGATDAFLTKMSSSGALIWSTYLGGSASDIGIGVAVDAIGNAFVTGNTSSTNFPTMGGFDTTAGGTQDAFLTKFTAAGALAWSSYLGGAQSETGLDVVTDPSGNVYVTGDTASTDFPTMGGFDTSLGGGKDAYLTKVSGAGAIMWSSYFGGSTGSDYGLALALDSVGSVILAGTTGSTDLPTTGGFDTTADDNEGYVAKISAAGSLIWSSYLGGTGAERCSGVAVNASNDIYLTGYTNSGDFPIKDALDAKLGGTGTGQDAYLTKVSSTGALLWSSYLGGSDWDDGQCVAVDPSGGVFVGGQTYSSDFPASGGFDTTYNAPGEAFIFHLPQAALGGACTLNAYCLSSICVDSVCCDKPCTGACEACVAAKKGSGVDGTCAPINDGLDPDKECAAAKCALDGTLVRARVCNGSGVCRDAGSASCAPYLCRADACPTTCATHADCVLGTFCEGSTCKTSRPIASACGDARECASGFCADGVCCDKACTGACEACTVAKKGAGAEGTCGVVAADTNPRGVCMPGVGVCAADGKCDGVGNCRGFAKAGTPCGSTACASGVVTGKVCKGDSAECVDSSTPCAPYGCATTTCKVTCLSDADCASGAFCTTTGACAPRFAGGTACTAARECASGFCVDGVCCNVRCDGQCEACDDSSSLGICRAIAGAPHGTRSSCAAEGTKCVGSCDGINGGLCAYPIGRECGARCADAQQILSTCSPLGACVEGAAQSCAGFSCGAERCKSECATNADCAAKFVCRAKVCEPAGTTCTDDGAGLVDVTGAVTPCTPYLCRSGACLGRCQSTADCSSEHVCDANSACVPRPPRVTVEDGGGCAVATRGAHSLPSVIAALALLGIAVSRRRSRIEQNDDGRVIARPDVLAHVGGRAPRRQRFAHQDEIEPPADVLRAHFAPGRPPREQGIVFHMVLAQDVDEPVVDRALEELSLIGPDADGARLEFLRMNVLVGDRDVEIAAHDQELAGLFARARPALELAEERHLRDEVLAAVRHVDRRPPNAGDVRLDDAALAVELGVGELRRVAEC